MLYIVSPNNRILAKFDAWSRTCMQDAEKFIKENNLELLRNEITFMGDMVYYVK